MDSSFILRLRSVSPFTRLGPCPRQRATPVLLLPSKRRPTRQCSPHRIRVTVGFHQRLIRHGLPTIGRRRASPVRLQDRCLQATTRTTPVSRRRHPYNRRRKAWATSALHQLAETGASRWPQCIPPEHLCLAPSPRGLLRPSRCPRPGCVPPLTVARFEQRFLNGYGPAQVGFGYMCTLLSQPHRLFTGWLPC
jgi:hypothetical protein